MRLCVWALGWIVLGVAGVGHGFGQTVSGMGTDSAGTPTTVDAALYAMADRAAVIFVGTVTAVRRVGDDPGSAAAGVVEIDFAVEAAVRGCQTGGTYTLREWAGRWAGADERYRVGQRMLMMLHAPGASGLSSPVGGGEGAIPVRGGGATIGEKDTTAGAQGLVADLRWVGARLARPVVYRKEAPRSPMGGDASALGGSSNLPGRTVRARLPEGAKALVGAEMAAVNATEEAAPQASVPAQEAAISTLISMLASPKKGGNDAAR